MLTKLTSKHPEDDDLWNDLAAARLVWAQRGDRPEQLVWALNAAERALALDPASSTAWFTHGLISEWLHLESRSSSWQNYLKHAPASAWTDEARRRLAQTTASMASMEEPFATLDRTFVPSDWRYVERQVEARPSTLRRRLGEVLLPSWAQAAMEGRQQEAAVRWATLRRLTNLLGKATGDGLLASAVTVIESAEREGAVKRLAALQVGHQRYGYGVKAMEAHRYGAAGDLFQEASDALGRGQSPFRLWAEVGLAICLVQQQRHDLALDKIWWVQEHARSDYGCLLGRALWITGAIQLFQRKYLESLESYKSALEYFEAVGEVDNQVNVQTRLAELSGLLGQRERSWRHRYRALRDRHVLHRSQDRYYVLGSASEAMLKAGATKAARRFHQEALALARVSGDPVQQAVAWRHLAAIEIDSGHLGEAEDALEQALKQAGLVPDLRLRRSVEVRLFEVAGRLAIRSDPTRAVEPFNAALEALQEIRYPSLHSRLLLYRADAWRAAASEWERRGRAERAVEAEAMAERDLLLALEEIEAEQRQVLAARRRGKHDDLWPAYFEIFQPPFEKLLERLVTSGRFSEAFSVAERARAREPLDLLRKLKPSMATEGLLERLEQDPAVDTLRRLLPAETLLLEYAVLDHALVIWGLHRDGVTTKVVKVGREKLARWVRRFDEQGPLDQDILERLYLWLIEPMAAEVTAAQRLVVVPDEVLHAVPFSALKSSEGYLVEQRAIAMAPSATLYIHSQQRDRGMARPTASSSRILLIGNPAFDRSVFPKLRDLPGAVAEVQTIADLYGESLEIVGGEAHRRRFLELLGTTEIAHFAGHAMSGPESSFLVLAPSGPGDTGVVYERQLLSRSLGPTRLVVLSACGTAGEVRGSLGVAPLVRPLLGNGVPAVLGSLWDVGDQTTQLLLTEFHKQFSAGVEASWALREAQLKLLRNPKQALRSPRRWAAFQVVGTTALEPNQKGEE